MQPFYQPVLFALFVWWFVTGLVFVAYGRSPRVTHLCFLAATTVMLLAVAGFIYALEMVTPAGVYLSLTCGILIWGWHVSGYYLGYITGPERSAHFYEMVGNGRSATPFARFKYALQASIYHELLIVSFLALLIFLSNGSPNRWGLWIFIALWIMHALAKLNVFLGVRNFRIEFLPAHLHKLDRLLSKQASNPLMPVTALFGTSIALVLTYRGIMPGTAPDQVVGHLAVGTMLILGVVENILLILPLPATLWGWGLRALPESAHLPAEPHQKKQPALRIFSKQVAEG